MYGDGRRRQRQRGAGPLSPRATVLAIAAAAFFGAVATALAGKAMHDRQVKAWEQDRDSVAAWQELEAQQSAQRQQRARLDSLLLLGQQATIGSLKLELAVLKARRRPVDTLVVPDTGAVPVRIVRVMQRAYQTQLALADSAAHVTDSVIAAQDTALTTYNRLLVARTQDFVAERVQRQHWEHLAKTAPVRKAPPKLFGLVSLPRVTVGVQTGVGMCTTGQACGYAGAGISIGWTL